MQLLLAIPRFPKKPYTLRLPERAAFRLILAALLLLVSGLFVAMKLSDRKPPRELLLPSAVYYHRIRKGMNQAEVENACGRPEYVQQMTYFEEEGEEWYYSASDGQIQINFTNGLVKRISRE